jgi:hypothetical protein
LEDELVGFKLLGCLAGSFDESTAEVDLWKRVGITKRKLLIDEVVIYRETMA